MHSDFAGAEDLHHFLERNAYCRGQFYDDVPRLTHDLIERLTAGTT